MPLSMVVLGVLYAKMFRSGSGFVEGAAFGALIGLYAIGSFVLHNYVNLNFGLKITVVSAIAYFVEWTVVGIVIGLVSTARTRTKTLSEKPSLRAAIRSRLQPNLASTAGPGSVTGIAGHKA